MNIFLLLLLCAVGVTMLYLGATLLVKGGVRIATALKIPPIIIGLTLLSFATSAPELVISIDAALKGIGDISLGNVMGSNIGNIGLILGLTALISPVRCTVKILRFDTPFLLLSTILLAVFILLNKGVNRLEAAILLIGFLVYTWKNVLDARKPKGSSDSLELQKSDEKPLPIVFAIFFVIIGVVLLIGGAKLFVNSSVEVARIFHVSDAVIGLTLVAVGTSLPELATSLVAAFKGENDIAVGNVIGSNIFNTLAILGISPLVHPIKAEGIQSIDLAVMLLFTVLMLITMSSRKTVSRAEGALLLFIYTGYMVWLCFG
ncbi:MAG: calcium/sodium antiporter [Victivallales bacterium]|nr:calcium/sodium antiporter [Victivallales bacterium]